MGMVTDNIERLTESKDIFDFYVKKFYANKDFPNSSKFFHKKVVGMVRPIADYGDLLKGKLFLEYLYATLSAWGMDRMDGRARLSEFRTFSGTIHGNLNLLEGLSKFKIQELTVEQKGKIENKLSVVFHELRGIMATESKIVGVSKAMHHLLPDLVPPIDGRHTLPFFYGNNYRNKVRGNEKEKFKEIFDEFCKMCKKLSLSQKDLREEWDTSVPKLIDNAIIGYIISSKY